MAKAKTFAEGEIVEFKRYNGLGFKWERGVYVMVQPSGWHKVRPVRYSAFDDFIVPSVRIRKTDVV